MIKMILRGAVGLLLFSCFNIASVHAEDWPTWRYDGGRTASSPEKLSDNLHLLWTRQYTPREMVWDDPLNQDLMQYDKMFEPIVADEMLFVGFNDQDKVVAFECNSGKEAWSYYADGPVRLPLSYSNGNIYFTSDDGYLYCLSADKGELKWKFRGGLSDRKMLGNKRLISTWPARGGVAVEDGVVYFAASIWPMMGTFIYAIDSETGKVIWKNDGTSHDYIMQPHNAYSFAGVAPQGTLAINGDYLFVPGGRSVPGCFDKKTGEFKYYHLAASKKSGGAFVCTKGDYFVNHHRDRNTVLYSCDKGKKASNTLEKYPVLDNDIFYFSGSSIVARNAKDPSKVVWSLDVDASGDLIKAGKRLYAAGKNKITAVQLNGSESPAVAWKKEVKGDISRLIAANGQLFAVTLDGRIMAFGEGAEDSETVINAKTKSSKISSAVSKWVDELLPATGVNEGYALYFGVEESDYLKGLADKANLSVVAVEPDASKIDKLRRQFDAMGVKTNKVAFLQGTPGNIDFAPYFSSLTIIEDVNQYSLVKAKELLDRVSECIRPFGGKLVIGGKGGNLAEITKYAQSLSIGLSKVNTGNKFIVFSREGAPKGTANWTHQYGSMANTVKSDDELVKLPLGVLWFGGNSNMDVLPRHGHGPAEQIMDGKLIIQGMNMLSARDVYTGRVLWKRKFESLGTFGVYYNETYVDAPLQTTYNQEHMPGANIRGTNYIVTPDYIYVAQGTSYHVLDIESGEIVKTVYLPGTKRCAYIGVSENHLITGAEFVEFSKQIKKNLKTKEDIEVYSELFEARDKRLGGSHAYGLSASRELIVSNRHTFKPEWQIKSKYGFVNNGITSSENGVLYMLDKMPTSMLNLLSRRGIELDGDFSITAYDIATGDTIWQNKTDVFGSWLSYSKEHDILLQATRPSRDMVDGELGERIIAHRASDGKVLWDKKIKYGNPPIIHGERIIFERHAYNLLTGEQINREDPITREVIPWAYTRTYGCNYIIGSENLLTFRSGAAGFYDLKASGGTGNFGGFKSSCSSNLIAANGVLNAPDYTRTCQCSYQNQTSLAFIHMPKLEYWTNNEFKWSGKRVKQLGINFGAPGDRLANNNTLWLDYPSVGGNSPDVPVNVAFVTADQKKIVLHSSVGTNPEEDKIGYIRTNSFTIDSDDYSYVASSAINGVTEVEITLSKTPEKTHNYSVLLYFAELEEVKAAKRIFNVEVQGKKALTDFNIAKEAGGINKLVIKKVEKVSAGDRLIIKLSSADKDVLPLLSGVEVILED
ncbi:hypothetical protein EYV94_20995 [Puteibacter caeruleilacunae]|nr:hypothetical protein EYV94_20995 [Puteibacter caeruleilacunae]